MNKTVKYILVSLGIVGLLVAIQVGIILYRVEFEKTELETYLSPDQAHQLVIYQIGEPDWPFGPAHGRFVLREGYKTVSQYNFSVANDGGSAHSGNFSVHWQEDRVCIVVNGEEQRDVTYQLFFDGRTTETFRRLI